MQFSYRAVSLELLSIFESHVSTLSASMKAAAPIYVWPTGSSVRSTHQLLSLHPVIIFVIINICLLEISIKIPLSIVDYNY